jgi:predicted DNA-binding transcriptional regulator AlpA
MDSNRLRYEMAKKNITIAMLCKHLKMSRSAFYRKCKGTSEFTQSEIEQIVAYLDLDSPMGIFFASVVS